MLSLLHRLNNLCFTWSYQIFRLVSGNRELSVKDLGVQFFKNCLVFANKDFFKNCSCSTAQEKKLFQKRWIQDEGLLKEPFSPESSDTCMQCHCSLWSPESMRRMSWGVRIYDCEERKHWLVSSDTLTQAAYSPSSALSSCSSIELFCLESAFLHLSALMLSAWHLPKVIVYQAKTTSTEYWS